MERYLITKVNENRALDSRPTNKNTICCTQPMTVDTVIASVQKYVYLLQKINQSVNQTINQAIN